VTFDPFAPVPKNDKPKENVYGDLLKPEGDVTPKSTFDPDKVPVPSEPAPLVWDTTSEVPAPKAEQPVVQNDVEPDKATSGKRTRRVDADRQRPVSERGTLPELRQVVKTKDKKFPLLTAALVATALVIGGTIGVGVFYTFTNKSDVEKNQTTALNAPDVPGLPAGVTGKQALDTDRLGTAENKLDKEAAEFVAQLDFLDELEKTPGKSVPSTDVKGEQTDVYAAMSDVYIGIQKLSPEDKEKVIDVVNSYLVDKGYSEFDPASAGVEDLYNQPQLSVGGARNNKDGSISSYSIVVNTSENTDTVSGIYITFYSSPHIKKGTDDDFKKFVTDSYNSTK